MKKINLNLNGKNLGFHFGLGFMGELLDTLDCSIEQLMEGVQKNPFKYVPRLMLEAHKYDCFRKGEESKYDFVTFIDLLDEQGGVMSENVSKFLQAFTDSITKNIPKEPLKKVGKKKAVLQK